MNIYIYLYLLISICNIIIINEFINNDNYGRYIMYFAMFLQSMLSVIIITDDDKYIEKLKFNCYFLKKIIMEKDKKIIYYMTITKKINQINLENNEKKTDKKQFDENEKKCDEEVEIIAPIISDKKNN